MKSGVFEILHRKLRETDHAYQVSIDSGGNMNVDFAAFVAGWHEDYKNVLDKPYLSQEDFSSLIRRAQQDRLFNRLALGGRLRHIAHFILKNV